MANKSLNIVYTGDIRSLKRAIAQIESANASLGSKLTSVGSKLDSIGTKAMHAGKSLTTHVTLPLLAIAAVSTKMAMDFEMSFRQIEGLAGKTGLSIEDMKNKTLALSKATGQAPIDLAHALYFVASASDYAAKHAFPILKLAAKGAEIGMGSVNDVAQTLTKTMNAYAGTNLNASKIMDVLTAAAKASSVEISDFATGLGPVTGTAAAVGLSFNDLAAGLASVVNAGVPFDRAVTGYRFLIQSLTAPTGTAQTALKDLGFTTDWLFAQISQPGGLSAALQAIADKAATMGSEGRIAFNKITGGARGGIVAMDLVGKHTETTQQMMTTMFDAAQKGATNFEDAFKTITTHNPAITMQKMIAGLQVSAIQLGQVLIPILVRDIIPAIRSAIHWFTSLSDSDKHLIVEIGLAVAAFGPLLTVLGSFLRIGGSILKLGGGISNAIAKIGGSAASSAASSAAGAAAGAEGAGAGAAAAASTAWIAAPVIGAVALLTAGYIDNKISAIQDAAAQKQLVDALNHAKTSLSQIGDAVGELNKSDLPDWAKGQIGDKINAGYEQWRAGILKVVNAYVDVQSVSGGFVRALALQSEMTKGQTKTMAAMVGGLENMGGSLTKTDRMFIHNLLAQHDFAGALAIVKARIDAVTGKWPVTVTTKAETAALDALKAKMLGSGFRQLGDGSWAGHGQMHITVTGPNSPPLPAQQIQDQIVRPMQGAGFRLGGGGWVAAAAMHVRVIGGDGASIYGGIVPNPRRDGQDAGKHYSEGFVAGLLANATHLQSAASRLRDVIKGALKADASAMHDAEKQLQDAMKKGSTSAIAAAQKAVANVKLSGFTADDLDRVKKMTSAWDQAVHHLTQLKDAFHEFRQSIKDGFSEFADLGSLVSQGWADYQANLKQYQLDLAQYQTDLADFQAGGGEGSAPTAPTLPTYDISQAVGAQVANAQRLAKDLQDAAAKGLSQQLLSQFASQGSAGADALEQLVANPALIAQLNQAQKDIATATGQTMNALGDQFFGKAIKHAQDRVQDLADKFQEFAHTLEAHTKPNGTGVAAALAALVDIINQNTAALGGTPPTGNGNNNGSNGNGPGGGTTYDPGLTTGGKQTPPINVIFQAGAIAGSILTDRDVTELVRSGVNQGADRNGGRSGIRGTG